MQRANYYCTVMLSASMLLRLYVFVNLGTTCLCVFIVSSHSLSLSVLTAIFAGEPGLAGFIEAKDDWSDGDNWSCKSCKAPAKSSPPTNQHPTFLQAGCPSCRPTNSVRALKGIKSGKLIKNEDVKPYVCSRCPRRFLILRMNRSVVS